MGIKKERKKERKKNTLIAEVRDNTTSIDEISYKKTDNYPD
ncbi:hypothetical protein [Candidatus Walczuchella monophlebidarum]|nr:hypothetical protein [Candidatus Walczuchella monophlebidarum]